MTKQKNDIATALSAVALASAAVAAIDQSMDEMREEIARLDERAAPLRAQIAELEGQEPMQIGPDQAHIDALLADPTSLPERDEIAATISQARKQDDVRRMMIATVRAAIENLDAVKAAIETNFSEMVEERSARWYDFACAAADYLAAEFRAGFSRLREEVMEPLIALAHIRDEQGRNVLPVGGRLTSILIDRGAVTMRKYERSHGVHGSWNTEKLFEEGRYFNAGVAAATIEQFRRALPSADRSSDKSP